MSPSVASSEIWHFWRTFGSRIRHVCRRSVKSTWRHWLAPARCGHLSLRQLATTSRTTGRVIHTTVAKPVRPQTIHYNNSQSPRLATAAVAVRDVLAPGSDTWNETLWLPGGYTTHSLVTRHGTGSHFVTQRPSDSGIQRPGDPLDPVTLF